ncbi:MAG: hypothetical protein OXC93_12335 [Rhodospirillaceae bacterium]|nr:hypothetical protein [Rhodospirillaceae bacterium]
MTLDVTYRVGKLRPERAAFTLDMTGCDSGAQMSLEFGNMEIGS